MKIRAFKLFSRTSIKEVRVCFLFVCSFLPVYRYMYPCWRVTQINSKPGCTPMKYFMTHVWQGLNKLQRNYINMISTSGIPKTPPFQIHLQSSFSFNNWFKKLFQWLILPNLTDFRFVILKALVKFIVKCNRQRNSKPVCTSVQMRTSCSHLNRISFRRILSFLTHM